MVSDPQMSFQYALFKIEWARRHLNNLDWFYQGYVRSQPYDVNVQRNSDGLIVVHAGMRFGIPREIPLFAGDIVHSLRSALDYCWMGLERSINPSAAGKLTFPFSDDEKVLSPRFEGKAEVWSIPGLQEFIMKKVRPYKDGNRIIWNLNRLDRRDKHNLLIVSLGRIFFDSFELISEDGSKISGSNMVVEVGSSMPLAEIGSPHDNFEFRYNISRPVEVVLSEDGALDGAPLIETLARMADTVEEIVRMFIERFPSVEAAPIVSP